VHSLPVMWYAGLMRRVLSIGRVVMVYLLLGFVTTWAVAWGLALRTPHLHDGWVSESIKLNDNWERKVNVTVEHGLGTVFASYETTESRMNDRGYTSHDYTYIHGVGPQKMDPWFESVLSWDLTGFDGWGQRRAALEQGVDSPWSLGIDAASGFPALALWCSWPATETYGPREHLGFGNKLEPNWSRPMLGGISLQPQLENAYFGVPGIAKRHIPRTLPYLPIWPGLALNTAFYSVLLFLAVRIFKGSRHLMRFKRGRCPACGHDLAGRFAAPCDKCGRLACKGRSQMVATP